MTAWKLDPPGISAVLTRVHVDFQELASAVDGEIKGGAFNFGDCALIASVANVAQYAMNEQLTAACEIATRMNAAVQGVLNATVAYYQGNLDMAATFQTEAALAAESGNFGYFETHGVK